MSKIKWDNIGERFYETGVRNGVLYRRDNQGAYPQGVAWNGLTTITESPSGAEATPFYADGIKYLNLMSNEYFGATIEAYTYPDEFAECDGSAELSVGVRIGQQPRKPFGLVYVTTLGNDTESDNYGYKIHIVYNALAAPTDKTYATINETPEVITFSWELSTTPELVTGHKPTATIVLDSTKVPPDKMALLEAQLFGVDADGETPAITPNLPLPDEIAAILANG